MNIIHKYAHKAKFALNRIFLKYYTRFIKGKSIYNPESIQLEVSAICNLKCSYCYLNLPNFYKRKEKLMSLESFKVTFNKLPNTVKFIVLNGLGEPLMNPELPQIINYIKKQKPDCIVRVTTNATLLSRHAEQLVDGKLDQLVISLNSTNKEESSKHKGEADLNEIIKGIEAINRIKKEKNSSLPQLSIRTVALKNINFYSIIDFAKEYDIKTVFFQELELIETSEGDIFNEYDQHQITQKEYETLRNDVTKYARQKGIDIRLLFPGLSRDKFHCITPWTRGFVLSDNNVIPCCRIENHFNSIVGEIDQEHSFLDVWNDEKYRKFRLDFIKGKASECKHCFFYDIWEKE